MSFLTMAGLTIWMTLEDLSLSITKVLKLSLHLQFAHHHLKKYAQEKD